MPLSDSLKNTNDKSNDKNILTCDNLLSNESVNKKDKKDSIEESQNDLLNSPLCTDEVVKNNESTEDNLRPLYKNPIVYNVSLLPENVTTNYITIFYNTFHEHDYMSSSVHKLSIPIENVFLEPICSKWGVGSGYLRVKQQTSSKL